MLSVQKVIQYIGIVFLLSLIICCCCCFKHHITVLLSPFFLKLLFLQQCLLRISCSYAYNIYNSEQEFESFYLRFFFQFFFVDLRLSGRLKCLFDSQIFAKLANNSSI